MQGVRDRVIWLDKFVSTEELAAMFECTSVFVTPFDESTPTSVRDPVAKPENMCQTTVHRCCAGMQNNSMLRCGLHRKSTKSDCRRRAAASI